MSGTEWVWFGLGALAGAMVTGTLLWAGTVWYLSRDRP